MQDLELVQELGLEVCNLGLEVCNLGLEVCKLEMMIILFHTKIDLPKICLLVIDNLHYC